MQREAVIPKRILIVLFGAIGDVVRALPLAVQIKQQWPSVELCWAVEPGARELVIGHAAVDRVFLFDRGKGLLGYVKFLQELRHFSYDITLDLQRLFKSGLAAAVTMAPRRLGFHYKNSREFNWLFQNEFVQPVERFSQKIFHYQQFAKTLGVRCPERLDFGLSSPDSRDEYFEKIFRDCWPQTARDKRVACILGSTWPSRFWTVEGFRELLKSLHVNRQMKAILIGGPAEREFANALLRELPQAEVCDLVGKTRLGELPALFRRVRLAVGTDSGPMHIAAAVGCPVVSLWGSTSPSRSKPYGSEEFVVQSAIGCSPCYRKQCPGLNRLCMRSISSQAVYHYIEAALEATPLEKAH